ADTVRGLRASGVGLVSPECPNSPAPMGLLGLVRGKKLMVGAIGGASPAVETPQDVATTLRNALQFVDPDQLWPSPNCGMAPLPRTVARAKLAALGAGAEIVRRELSEGSLG